MKHYDDIDYDQFLYPHWNPDFQPDLHWNFLPASEIAPIAVANPPRQIILVPAGPNYSPTQDEIWPAVHQAVLDCLAPHPEFRDSVVAAVSKGHRRPPRLAKSSALQ